jgi:DNA-binding transcriptional ArsR family regulator
MTAVAEIFRALGDPVRLTMMQRLSSGDRCTITDVSSELGITRQGARKHLQVLADAKLVNLEPRGRDVFVKLDRAALDEAAEYIAELEKQWDRRLSALKMFLEEGG